MTWFRFRPIAIGPRFEACLFAFLLVAALLIPFSKAQAMKIQEVKSPGGITAWLVEEHSVPLIALALCLRRRQRAGPGGQGGPRQFPGLHDGRRRRRPQRQAVPGAHGRDRHAHGLRRRARCLLRQLRDADREPRQGRGPAGAGAQQAALRHRCGRPYSRAAGGRSDPSRARSRPGRLRDVGSDRVRGASVRAAGQRYARSRSRRSRARIWRRCARACSPRIR